MEKAPPKSCKVEFNVKTLNAVDKGFWANLVLLARCWNALPPVKKILRIYLCLICVRRLT